MTSSIFQLIRSLFAAPRGRAGRVTPSLRRELQTRQPYLTLSNHQLMHALLAAGHAAPRRDRASSNSDSSNQVAYARCLGTSST